MKYYRPTLFFILLIITSSISLSACLSDGGGDSADGDGDGETVADGDDDNGDADEVINDGDVVADGDVDEDIIESVEEEIEPEAEAEPEELALTSVKATDDDHVAVEFNMPLDVDYVETSLVYSIVAENRSALEVKKVKYDPIIKTATLLTGKQKLGFKYTIEISDPEDSEVKFENEFLAADSHSFWVADFSSPYYDMEELEAKRVGVGKNCVVYAEKGYTVNGLYSIIKEFDDNIYPIETTKLIAAPDIDENGKITILFLNGGNYYGGYFSPINSIPDEDAMEWWGVHSNGMEIIHINILSDTEGVPSIVAHEFQHLLYQERHGFNQEDWLYHNEGMAESAVHMVYGESIENLNFYIYDPRGIIKEGLSLVNWTYAQYENYVLAYLFWTYLSGRLTGNTDGYIDIFNLETGSPAEVDQFIQNHLGVSFMQAHMDSIIAFWAQHDDGPYSFNGMIEMVPGYSPVVPAGTASLNLEPFAAGIFRYNAASINYPETVGSNIRYAGVNPEYEVDTEAPFAVDGGILVAYNANFASYSQWKKEHSGPDISSVGNSKSLNAEADKDNICEIKHVPAWADPPPVNPDNSEAWSRWLESTEKRIALER